MRIVIDLQGGQGESRKRGIGRYSLSITEAIIRNNIDHEIILVLSGSYPETVTAIREEFSEILPAENIHVWYHPGPSCYINSQNKWRRESAELVREAFIANLNPSIVLICSLFEGLHDDAISSVHLLSQDVPVATILYDLIPLIHRSPYLDNPILAEWYDGRINQFLRSNLLLAISESSRQESMSHLGFPSENVVNIMAAADSHFCVQELDPTEAEDVKERYHLERPFLMYTGGIDHRKNIEGLIRAYSLLPVDLRKNHQLAIICSIQPHDEERLKVLAGELGLDRGELILTGYVPEKDLVTLYNLCKAFIFPSWHEGFGLPALEAMACGRAVIGANSSSIPEVIGNEEALFDPLDTNSMVQKIEQVLTDENFRKRLERHALQQARRFSWDESARIAIGAMERYVDLHAKLSVQKNIPASRPRLAYVSPLPPARSGISSYSAELLPELLRHYQIDVIVSQNDVLESSVKAGCPIRSVEWFLSHADSFDRVLYHFGNSEFHQHMFALLEKVPGIVVLHDFFLSGIAAHMECHCSVDGYWSKELYRSHGYHAFQHRFKAEDTADVVWKYPCNLEILRRAQGVIVHSQSSIRLAQEWYGKYIANDWACIPHLRHSASDDILKRRQARAALGFDEEDVIFCSFGIIGPSKLNHRLLEAWLNSTLPADARCKIIFVGEFCGGHYEELIQRLIGEGELQNQIRITGWCDDNLFRQYLTAADIGVQLRTNSRGETSGTVLDCMNHGIPTIVNANGSMADLSEEAVWKLPDQFTEEELVNALTKLRNDDQLRRSLGDRSRAIVKTNHSPRFCADLYFQEIERFDRRSKHSIASLVKKIAQLDSKPRDKEELYELSRAIDTSIKAVNTSKQLFLDISELVRHDWKSGVQRVVRSVLKELLLNPPEGFRIEPVYATVEEGYRYARRYIQRFLECQDSILEDDPIEFSSGDIFFGLDYLPDVAWTHRDFYQHLRRHGVSVHFMVYDLLCLKLPEYFDLNADIYFTNWLSVITESDGVVCISATVADDVRGWIGENQRRQFKIEWNHIGGDVQNSVPTLGLPDNAREVLERLKQDFSFLTVGTLEPRKGHEYILKEFEKLWNEGWKFNLILVGKQGWMVDGLVEKLRSHPENNRRLFWMEGISDEYLERIYATSTCLINASFGEGFGLPLIEAAQHKLPIIARDLPVFREVAGDHAFYFSNNRTSSLASKVKEWVALYQKNEHPKSEDIPWLTWKESTRRLVSKLVSSPN